MSETSDQKEAHSPKERRLALLLLLGVCVAWGSTFPLMKEAMSRIADYLPASKDVLSADPVIFLALRFAMAVGCMALLFAIPSNRREKMHFGRGAWKYGAILGALFTLSFYFQVYGLKYTTPAISAFITSLYVVFTPLAVLLLQRVKPKVRVLLSAFVALAGACVIANSPDSEFVTNILGPGIGLSFFCAIGFAFHITLTDISTRKEDPLVLSFLMLLFATLVALATIPLVVDLASLWKVLPDLLLDWEIMWRVIIMVVFATVFAVVIWNRYQKVLGPTRAAILYTLEPVFAALFSVALGHDPLTITLFIGGGLIVGANLWCELSSNGGIRRGLRIRRLRFPLATVMLRKIGFGRRDES